MNIRKKLLMLALTVFAANPLCAMELTAKLDTTQFMNQLETTADKHFNADNANNLVVKGIGGALTIISITAIAKSIGIFINAWHEKDTEKKAIELKKGGALLTSGILGTIAGLLTVAKSSSLCIATGLNSPPSIDISTIMPK